MGQDCRRPRWAMGFAWVARSWSADVGDVPASYLAAANRARARATLLSAIGADEHCPHVIARGWEGQRVSP